jgi:hypothetical protein
MLYLVLLLLSPALRRTYVITSEYVMTGDFSNMVNI